MEKKLTTLLLGLMLCVTAALAQTKVSGVVISASDNQPIAGAHIATIGRKQLTVTDDNGKFALTIKGKDTRITVSYIGMESTTVKGGENMRIVLKDNQSLGEVVVTTGMTKTDRRLFTGATDKIDISKSRLSGVADISRSLEGQAAGVSVQNVSGTFGAAPKIRVRGATSIYGASKPLWVVDGVIMEDVSNIGADDLASGNPETLISSAIAGLNADDIESFQVLKDGSATSIYGARAMAGVIVVTTKKGRQGQAHLNYTGEFTTRLVPSYRNFDILNSQQQMGIYRELRDKGWLNYSDVLNGSDYGVYGKMYELQNSFDAKRGQFLLPHTTEAENAYLQQAEFRNTNWFKELFSPAIMQNHSVSLSGGTAKSSYYASLSALLDPGWYKQSDVKRYTVNLNLTHHILDNLTLNLIGGASYRDQRAPGSLGQDVDVVNGAVKRDFDINPYSYAVNTSRVLDPKAYYVANYAPFNIFNELDNNYIDLGVLDAKFQFELKYKPIRGLELTALGAFKHAATSQQHNIKDNSNQALTYRAMPNGIIRDANKFLYRDPDNPTELPYTVLPKGGIMHKTDNRMSDYHFRATANYNRTFDNRHTVNLFGGMETTDIDRTRTRFEGWGLQYESGEAPFYPYQHFKKSIEEGNDYYQLVNSNWRTVAFYGNATYSYRGRYVVNGTYRYEGSNQLGRNTDARWMSTWNLSGAWNIHEERWFAKLAPLSHLTLRTSYSLTGTPPDPSLVSSTTIFRNSTPYRLFASDQESGLAITELGNALLTYEKKNEFNVGIDAGLWNNRINATLDVYTRNNYDEIGPMVTQGMSGQIVNWGNVAEMKSNGVELSITSSNIKQKDFTWSTSFVFSYTNTEITKLFNNGRVIDLVSGNGFAMKGFPARALFSVPFLGLNDAGIPLFRNEKGAITTDDINFQERNNTGYLKYEGPTDPKFVGSLGNVFSYKGLHLNVFLTYSFGGVVRLDPKFRTRYTDMTSMTQTFLNRWMAPGDEKVTDVPGILSKRQFTQNRQLRYAYNAYNFSSVRTAKSDFIRLKEISLSYDLPASLFKDKGIRDVSVKLQATNLFLLYSDKKLHGQDPEFLNAGGVASPMPKQFTLTLKFGI